MMKSRVLTMGMALVVVAAGCGYTVGSSLPEKYRTVAVPVFRNETRETEVQAAVTNALRRRIALDGRLRLASEKESDLILRGTLTSYSVRAQSYLDDDGISRFRANLGATVTLEDRATGEVLWRMTDIEGSTDHFAAGVGGRSMSRGATRYFVPDATSFPSMEEGQGAAEAIEDLAVEIFIRLMEY
jgi:hypothetical protein